MIKRREFLQICGMSSLLYFVSPWEYLAAQESEEAFSRKVMQPIRRHYGNRFGCSGLPTCEEDLIYNSDF